MKTAILLSLVAGLAVGAPQEVDYDAIANIPVPTAGPAVTAVEQPDAYNAAATSAAAQASVTPSNGSAKKMAKRGAACAPQPDGYGPKPPVDTDSSFLSYQTFSDGAASAPTPQGYSLTFQDKKASQSYGTYLGLYTLKTYDTITCQQKCDAHPDGCTSFNIYYERDPTVDPGTTCPNPPSFTNIKCALWKSEQTPEGARNDGQWRGPADANGVTFHVVIAGSNGYKKNASPPSQPGYTGPVAFGGAINAPLDKGVDTYIGYKYIAGSGDLAQCAGLCTAQTGYNSRHKNADGCYKPCNFYNAYILSQNNIPQGVYCSMYTREWAASYATNFGQYRGSDRYSVSSSYGYTASPLDTILATCGKPAP